MYDMTIFYYIFLNERPFLFFFERLGGKMLSVFKENSVLTCLSLRYILFVPFSQCQKKRLKKATKGKDLKKKKKKGYRRKTSIILKCGFFLLRTVCIFSLEI